MLSRLFPLLLGFCLLSGCTISSPARSELDHSVLPVGNSNGIVWRFGLKGPRGKPVVHLAVSPEGDTYSAASMEHQFGTWWIRGNERASVTYTSGPCSWITYSPDTTRLAYGVGYGPSKNEVSIVDVRSRLRTHVLRGHRATVIGATFVGSDVVVSVDEAGLFRRWTLDMASAGQDVFRGEAGISLSASGGGGTLLATASKNGTAQVWSCSTERLVYSSIFKDSILSLSLAHEGGRLAVGLSSGDLVVVNLADHSVLRMEDVHPAGVSAVGLDMSGSRVVAGGVSGEIQAFAIPSGARLYQMRPYVGEVFFIAPLRDNSAFLVSGREGPIRRFTFDSGAEDPEFRGPAEGPVVACAELEPPAWAFLEGLPSLGEDTRAWALKWARDPSFPAEVSKVELRGALFGSMRGQEGNEVVVGMKGDGDPWIGRFKSGQPDGVTLSRKVQVSGMRAFAASQKNVGVGLTEDDVSVLDLAALSPTREFPIPEGCGPPFAISGDGKRLALSGTRGQAVILQLSDGREVFTTSKPERQISGLSLSIDGSLLVLGTKEGWIECYDTNAKGELFRGRASEGPVAALAISPDGRFAATGGRGGAVSVWDLWSGKERARLSGAHQRPLSFVAFTENGRGVCSVGRDGLAVLWSWDHLSFGAAPVTPTLSIGEVEALWEDLASSDAYVVEVASRALVSGGSRSVPMLYHCLSLRPPEEALAEWIKQLDSETIPERALAFSELMQMGTAAEAALRQALAGTLGVEGKTGALTLLSEIEAAVPRTPVLRRRTRAFLMLAGIPGLESRRAMKLLSEHCYAKRDQDTAAGLLNEMR